MSWLNISIIIYALLMLGGGIGGYKAAGSQWSLIVGISSAVLLLGATALAKTNPKIGYMLATAVTLALLGVFLERYMKTQKVTARWDVTAACQQPSGADYDPATNRLFLGCRGKMVAPTMVVVDGDSGKVVASLPLGRGCDEVQFDAASKQIFTANGVDGNVVVYKQIDADHYAVLEAFSTRPGARVLRYDAETQRIFMMANAGTFEPSQKNLARFNPWYINKVFANSLVVLTYGRGPAAAR